MSSSTTDQPILPYMGVDGFAKIDERITEQTTRKRDLGIRHEALQAEIEKLSSQVGDRKALEIKQDELKRKEAELKTAYVDDYL